MATKDKTELDDFTFLTATAHVIGRAGLAMVGAMCGTFVAAQFAKADAALFDSAPFIAAMVLLGFLGFYLGVDIPRWHVVQAGFGKRRSKIDAVHLASATGTFLAAIAALISVYGFILDEPLVGKFEDLIGAWWGLGVAMQIGAGLTGRLSVTVV
jgi:hypothetical protein